MIQAVRMARLRGERRRADRDGTQREGTKDRREELWSKFLRTRWKKHRNRLVEVYLPLVRAVAEQVAARLPRTVDPEDLMSAGVFGLLQSVENYDPGRGTKFETFCRMRIRGSMIDELRNQDLLSRDARGRANQVADVWHSLLQELGREPNASEIAAEVGLPVRKVEDVLQKTAHQTMISLDATTREGSSPDELTTVSEDLVDADLEPSEAAHQKDLLRLIERCLSRGERDILMLRYRDGLTMRGIGRLLGLSESRVCQLHSRLLSRLQRRLGPEL